jgi:two-component system, sensor histidine kinase
MSAEAQTHIFEAFTQAETSTTRKYGGTGLGLAISAKLVKILGGELKLESELNKGSHFYFSIPAKQVEMVEENTSKIDLNKFFDAHILLVEDNKVNQMLMSALLRKHHITFDLAEDGLEAIASFKTAEANSKPYDMILMDENMPNLNGIEATKQIRLFEKDRQQVSDKKSHTPIIALTANAMTGDRERFLDAGMDEYTTKPIKRPRLLEIFNLFLK